MNVVVPNNIPFLNYTKLCQLSCGNFIMLCDKIADIVLLHCIETTANIPNNRFLVFIILLYSESSGHSLYSSEQCHTYNNQRLDRNHHQHLRMQITTHGSPSCPACNGILYWDNDFSKSDLCLVPVTSPKADGVVSCSSCVNCGRDWLLMEKDGRQELINLSNC